MCAEGPIAWYCKLQPTIAASTTEAEIISAQSCVMMVLSLRKIMEFLGFKQQSPTIVREDNLGVIAISRDPMLYSKMKHMQIKQSFIRDYQEKGEVQLIYIESVEQLADILTKVLEPKLFVHLRDRIVVASTDPAYQGEEDIDHESLL